MDQRNRVSTPSGNSNASAFYWIHVEVEVETEVEAKVAIQEDGLEIRTSRMSKIMEVDVVALETRELERPWQSAKEQ